MNHALAVVILVAVAFTPAAAQSVATPVSSPATGEAIVALPGSITWGPAPALPPPEAQVAVLEGDPSKVGPFTMRLSVPDGYRIAPHFHPADEHVTVLSGTFLVGMGETFDESKLAELPAGSFGVLPSGMRHFAQARGATVLHSTA